jgi:NAD(P)-dependent dehydrogenase (short-subunit alcohol dehydrogenase family)
MRDLAGRTVVLTGAASDIGRATAPRFASEAMLRARAESILTRAEPEYLQRCWGREEHPR